MNLNGTIFQNMTQKTLLVLLNFLFMHLFAIQAFAAGNDNHSPIEPPCFFINSSDKIFWNNQFSMALSSDIERGRKKLDAVFTKAMPEVTGSICADVDRITEREKTSLLHWYDQTLSKSYVSTRLQKVWSKRWSPKLCGLVQEKILEKNTPLFNKVSENPEISLKETIEDFVSSLIQTDWLETTGTRLTIITTLEEMKAELNLIAKETNTRLNTEIPRRLNATRDQSIKALELCIANEKAKLK